MSSQRQDADLRGSRLQPRQPMEILEDDDSETLDDPSISSANGKKQLKVPVVPKRTGAFPFLMKSKGKIKYWAQIDTVVGAPKQT